MRAIPRQRIPWPARALRRTLAGWRTGTLWSGPAVERFEREVATLLGVPHAAAVPSGRVGLSLVLEALELPPGAEVICPAFGYPAVPCVVEALGFKLRFVDCELETLGMDPAALRRTLSSRTGAVIVAHLFGVPCRIRELAALASAQGVPLIEDCAHTLCARIGERAVGSFGAAACFSFETSKLVNTLGGGMVATRDEKLAELIRKRLRAQPRNGARWLLQRLLRTGLEALATRRLPFQLLGRPLLRRMQRTRRAQEPFASGYKPDEFSLQGRQGQYTNLQAELGLGELERARASLERRRSSAAWLHREAGSLLHFQRPADADCAADYLLCTALVPDLERTAQRLLDLGIDTKHHYMNDCARLFGSSDVHAGAARAEREVLHVPAYPELDDADLDQIAAALACVARELGSHARAEAPARDLATLADVG